MGCWNETCLLTRLPIRAGQKVTTILIAQRNNPHAICYTDDLYRPISLHITGEYDEYGGLNHIKDASLHADFLRETALYTKTEDDDLFRKIYMAAITDHKLVQILIQRARQAELYIKCDGKMTPVYPIMILQDFYEFALNAKRDICVDSTGHVVVSGKIVDATSRYGDYAMKAARLHAFMTTMRIALAPTSGSGSQNELDAPYQLAFYQNMLDTAKDIVFENR